MLNCNALAIAIAANLVALWITLIARAPCYAYRYANSLLDNYINSCAVICNNTVVWEIFDSKNISWVLATHENYITTINS